MNSQKKNINTIHRNNKSKENNPPIPSINAITSPVGSATTAPAKDEQAICGICLEPVKIRGVMDSCKHDFCYECILQCAF